MDTNLKTKYFVRSVLLSAVVLSAFLLLGCGGGGGSGGGSGAENRDDAFQPFSGTWRGTSDFGSIEFLVTPDGGGIDEITLFFLDYSCGIVTSNVTLTTVYSPSPLDIGSHQLTAEVSSGADRITILGTFDSSESAAGNFTADYDVNSENCSGSWSASPAIGSAATIIEWDDSSPESTIQRDYSGGLLSEMIFHRRFFVRSGSGVVYITAAIKDVDEKVYDDFEASFTVEENNTYDIQVNVKVGGQGSCSQYWDFLELSSPSVGNTRKIYFDDCVSIFEIKEIAATIY
jgi:hypothetical protein